MGVHFVAGTGGEVDDAQIEVVARLRRQQRLPRHGTTREQGCVYGLSRDLVGFVYLLWSILLSGYRAFLAYAHALSAAPAGGALLHITGFTGRRHGEHHL